MEIHEGSDIWQITMGKIFEHPQFYRIQQDMGYAGRYFHVITGPRQTGKTTVAIAAAEVNGAYVYANADEPICNHRDWIASNWQKARSKASTNLQCTLIIDQVHRLCGWAEIFKDMLTTDASGRHIVKLVLISSMPALIKKDLTKHFGGRYQLIRLQHWPYRLMQEAFGYSIRQYLYYGGYPGGYETNNFPDLWRQYLLDRVIEPAISRDIFPLRDGGFLRRIYALICQNSGHVMSYRRICSLLDSGDSKSAVSHYLCKLAHTGLIGIIGKFDNLQMNSANSSPKLLVRDTSLMTAFSCLSFSEVEKDPVFFSHLKKTAVGAHLINGTIDSDIEVFYWLDRNRHVDYILQRGRDIIMIEVLTNASQFRYDGYSIFAQKYHPKRHIVVGDTNVDLSRFFATSPIEWFK